MAKADFFYFNLLSRSSSEVRSAHYICTATHFLSYAAVAKFTVKEQQLSRKECQVFFPVVGIGYPQPLTRKGVLLLPLWVQGGGGYTLVCGGSGWGYTIPTKG